MYIGRLLHRFLNEEGGQVTHLELDCLKPRVGNDNVLHSYLSGQEDRFVYPISDVFGGPLNVTPVPRRRSWRVKDLDKVEAFYLKIEGTDRSKLMEDLKDA